MNRAPAASSEQGAAAGRWLWVLGVAGVVFAARLREVYFHSGPTPALDQWDAEAQAILVPWLLANAGGWNAVLAGFGALYIIAAVFWLLIRNERVC